MIRTIIVNHFKLYWQDKWVLIIMGVLPLFFIWLFVQVFSPYLFVSRFSDKFTIALADNDNTLETRMVYNQLKSTPYMQNFVDVRLTDEKTALDLVKSGKAAGSIIIPKGFTESLYQGENRPLKFVADPRQTMFAQQIKNQLESAGKLVTASQSGYLTVWHYLEKGGASPEILNKEFNQAIFDFMKMSLGRNNIFEETTVSGIPKVNFAEYFTAALTVVFVAFMGIRETRMLAEEKEAGILLRLRSSPVRLWEIFLGKFAASFGLLFLQLWVIIIGSNLMFKNYLGHQFWSLTAILAATAFALSGWTMMIGTAALFTKAADLFSYLGTLLLALIGGNIFPLYTLPESVRQVSNFTFNKWAMDGLLKIFAGNPDLSAVREVLFLCMFGLVMQGAALILLNAFWRNKWTKFGMS